MNYKGLFVVGLLLGRLLPLCATVDAQTPEAAKPIPTLDRAHSTLAAYSGERIEIKLQIPPAFWNVSNLLKIIVTNAEHKPVETREIALSGLTPDSSPQLFFTPKIQEMGYYNVSFSIWDNAKRLTDLYTSFSILTPVEKVSDESRFGVYTNSNFATFKSMLPMGYVDILNKSGARWGTFTTYWFMVQPKEDTWDWSELDQRFEALKQANIQPIPTMFGIPEWASSYTPDMRTGGDGLTYQVYPPKDMKAWGNYVFQFVTRYRDQLKYIRVWNEFDNDYFMGSAHDFAEMLKVAYSEAHRAKPDIQVIIDTSFAKTYYYEMLWRDGAVKSFDVIAIHNYHQLDKVLPPEQTMFRNEYEAIRMWRDHRAPDRPIIDDEFGLLAERSWIDQSWLGQGSLAHANQMVRAHLLGFSCGLERMIWFPAASYEVPDKGKIFTESAGLLHTDLSPQPAYSAYHTMATLLQNAHFVRQIPMSSPTQYAYVFQSGGKVITAVWSIADAPEWASFKVDTVQVEELSMLGIKGTIPVENGFFSIPLNHSPQYVISEKEIENENCQLRTADCEFKFNLEGNPGDLERAVTVEAINHSSCSRIFFLEMNKELGKSGFPMKLSLNQGQQISESGKMLSPSSTLSGHFPVSFTIAEHDGYPLHFPMNLAVKTQDKPLWKADTAQTPTQYLHKLPKTTPVDSITLTLPAESGSFFHVEAKRPTKTGQEEWYTVHPNGMGHGTESIPIHATISAIRVTFEQLLTASDLEDPKQFQPIPSDPKNTPEDYIRAGGWCTGKKQISLLNTEGHTGSHCIYIESDNRADGWSTCDQYLRVKENTYYSISAYGKVPQDADYNGYSSVVAVNGDTKQYMAGVYLTHADNNWHRYFFTIRTTPGQTCLRLSCVVNGRGKAMFDDIMAVEGTRSTDIPQIVSLDIKESQP